MNRVNSADLKSTNHNFKMIETSLNVIGITKEARNMVYMHLAMILNLGNIHFSETDVSDANDLCISDVSMKYLDNVAGLSNINSLELKQTLLTRTICFFVF